jgi:frataxin-like iron-binding protein CyaY
MEDIKSLLANRVIKKKNNLNRVWLLAEEVAKVTGEKANRYLRICKDEWVTRRSLNELKDLIGVVTVRNRGAYFFWLAKKFKKEKKNENH